MQVPFFDLQRQYAALKPEIQAAMQRVLDRQMFILGDELKSFENGFAAFLNVPYCCGVASGTTGLLLALKLMGVGRDDEVITTPMSFIATTLAITELGAKPVFVDIDPRTYQIDARLIEQAITSRTKAILPVHLYGAPCDIEAIVALGKKHGLKVVEDACQAHGAMAGNKMAGTLGDTGVFSFYPGKNLGAYGDAGAVCLSDKKLYESALMLRNYGQKEKYHHQERGDNNRLDELQAAILSVKLKYLKDGNAKRRAIAEYYRQNLQDVFPVQELYPETISCYHQFVIESKERTRLMEYLAQNKIQTLIHYPIPIHLQGTYRSLGFRRGDFPLTEAAAERVISLPIFPELSVSEQEYVVQVLRKFHA